MPDPETTGSPTSATTDSAPAGGTPPSAPVAAPGGDSATPPASGTPAAPVTPPAGSAPIETSALGGDLPSGETSPPAGDPPAGDPATPPAPVLPEKYELALDGMTVDPALVELADPVFRELNLSNDQANQLLPVAQQIQAKAGEAALQQVIDAGARQRAEWLETAKADPEIGGGKWDETLHLGAKALDTLGFKEGHPFRQALTESGFGNHPDMLRLARTLGELVSEDGSFPRSGAGDKREMPVWERMYGKQAD